MDYIVRTEGFEGPFDLLLELIRKKKMDIHDLQIADITQEYMAQLASMQEADIHVTSSFIEMASLLLEIKTKLLLAPTEKQDPRDELVQQLLDYKTYREAIGKMRELKEVEQRFFKRQRVDSVRKKKKGTLQDILLSYQKILARKEETAGPNKLRQLTEELAKIRYTVADRIVHVEDLLSRGPIQVTDYFGAMRDKEELTVTFGALLELVKRQSIGIYLENEDVWIEQRRGSDESETSGGAALRDEGAAEPRETE